MTDRPHTRVAGAMWRRWCEMTDDPLAKFHILIETGAIVVDRDRRYVTIHEPTRDASMSDDEWSLMTQSVLDVDLEFQRMGYTVERF